jgi:hypothetical protein
MRMRNGEDGRRTYVDRPRLACSTRSWRCREGFGGVITIYEDSDNGNEVVRGSGMRLGWRPSVFESDEP